MSGNDRQHRTLCFQNLLRKEYFEGWYFKQVSSDENTVLCLIPGLSVHHGTKSPFIQVILARKDGEVWHQTTDWLDVSALHAQNAPFSIQLDGNHFRRDGITLAYFGQRLQVRGELRFSSLIAPPASLWAPTVMGPFSYLPGMECIHSIISLTHALSGSLEINGRPTDFTGGKGYLEKDWGSSFPGRYVWLQSNHFARDGSLFFSWADIPALGTTFKGYIAHLYYGGIHHRYATYTRGGCGLTSFEQEVEIILKNRDSELQIKAVQSGGASLAAPHRGQMVHTIKEGLFGQLSFCLERSKTHRPLCDRTNLAGIELVWDKGELQG